MGAVLPQEAQAAATPEAAAAQVQTTARQAHPTAAPVHLTAEATRLQAIPAVAVRAAADLQDGNS